jgi:hypothetical protein
MKLVYIGQSRRFANRAGGIEFRRHSASDWFPQQSTVDAGESGNTRLQGVKHLQTHLKLFLEGDPTPSYRASIYAW